MRQLYLTLCLQRSTSAAVEMTPWLMAIFCLVTAGCSNVTDQQTSETHHDQQVAILKQIRKVNEDGSYTYGYEAGDGSFKEHVSVVQSIPRLNRTTTTKKPNIVYPSSTEASTKSSVVQSIPRNRKTTTTSTSTTTTTTEQPKMIFSHYLKGTGKNRPRFIINGQQRPLIIEEESETEDEDSQINRPTTDDKTSTYRKIIFAKRPVDQTLRPISDDFMEKEDETKVTSGNNLRRQLHEDTTKPNPIVEGSNDDHSDVYGGSLSTTRPLFTTTTPPRVLQRVSPAGRVEKPKVYVNRENLASSRSFENVNSRAFEAETKMPQEERVSQPQPVLIRGPPRLAAENREYLRQSTEPIFVRQQPDQFLREVPGGRILVPAQPNIEEDPAYRPLSINRILLRPLPNQQPLYSTTTDANIHYLTENPVPPEQEEDPRVAMAPGYMRPRPFPRPVIFQEPRPVLRPVSPPVSPVDEREYQTTSEYPYRSSTLALPPEPPNPINPPLSRRDFQLLLRRLLVSQYGVQALSYPKTYLEDALYDQQPYPSYQPGYQTVAAPRSEIPGYDQQVPLQYGDRVPVRRPVFTRPLSPVYQPQQYEDYNDGGRYSKRVYRQKFYAQEIGDEGDEILPAPIREALLLRMLQLAINAERPPPMLTSPIMTTTTPASRYRKTGPVRSVQIISDEEEDGKETMKKKM
ncbi:uncharacterized protein LOC122719935 isoform X2 [Apis laboriosa]|uniref:uncharacterized protein LOC122719935 isoform X2 n=1 Tax=Apis laboriosa TaxID=183418 RepID=UPI001CC35F95|nr:uncharacterized protein LOC122719935 isoform X2 [Apis laboriosa]